MQSSPVFRADTRRVLSGALLLTVLLSIGCSRKAPDQTAFMRSTERVNVSTETLRIRVRSLADSFAGSIQTAADNIIVRTDDLEAQRFALEWKVAAIPQVLATAFQRDPAVAFLDTWAFASQMNAFFSIGPGRAAFGEHQELALRPGTYIQQQLSELGRSVVTEATGELTKFAQTYADEHPIESWSFSRESIVGALSEAYKMSDSLGALAQLSNIDSTVDDLSLEVRAYGKYLPLITRWHAELLTLGILKDQQVTTAVSALASLSVAGDDVEKFLQEFPELLQSERATVVAAVTAERQQALEALEQNLERTLESIAKERTEAQGYLTSERRAILQEVDGRQSSFFADLEAERTALLEQIRAERQATFADLDRSTQAIIDESSRRLEGVTDRFLDRLINILIFLAVLAAGFMVAAFFLFRNVLKRRSTTP